MGLLTEIQQALMQEAPLGPVLLKLRFLAFRLGSNLLEEWVKFEADGYPPGTEVPAYRRLGVGHTATFSGPFGSGIKNAPIPPYLITQHAGEQWNQMEFRQSVSEIEVLASTSDGPAIDFNRANMMLLLQGNVYADYACNSVTGSVSRAGVIGILSSVRTRILEFTLELERALPDAVSIEVGQTMSESKPGQAETVTHIAQQTVYGNVTTITNSGPGATFAMTIGRGDTQDLSRALSEAGITQDDAREFSTILASESPESRDEPFGPQAKAWITRNIGKAVNGTWKIGVAVATQLLTEASLRFYGLK